ncbi:hypothetical protein ID866_7657 [Astraeus odoratus]|nr:hypothetical protein ID866_7657 [Astraeus odoratus]
MSRLQQLVSIDDALKVYNNFTNLPNARFVDHILTLPCILYDVLVVKLRQMYMDHHIYDVHAAGLRPVQIITQEKLKEATDPTRLPYILIRPWDRKLVNYSEKDRAIAGYKILMQLEQPFMAFMLLRLPEGEYKRICSSRVIVVRTLANGPASIVNSKIATLDIV